MSSSYIDAKQGVIKSVPQYSKQMCKILHTPFSFTSLSALSPHQMPQFSLYLQFPRGGSCLTIPSLNYISIPATVALVTAAMVTSQSVQVEWPECGTGLPDGKRGENRTNPLFMSSTHTLATNSGG